MHQDDDAPQRTKTLGFAAVSAAGLTMICVIIGQGAAQFADLKTTEPAPAVTAARTPPNFNAIDYATTGSIKGQVVVLAPCDR